MANGVLIIDKPQGWTSSGHSLAERGTALCDTAYPCG